MKKSLLLFTTFFILTSHDMFLKMDTYFLKPNNFAVIKLYNSTFEKSENVITRDRMMDVSLVGKGQRNKVDTAQWSEKDSMTLLHFTSGKAGTWVAGVSIKPKQLAMKAVDFNHYLEHDGVLDMLEWRKNNNALETDAIEEYAKHVKAIFQVGDIVSDDYKMPLGYPIEFIPLENPYSLKPGQDLDIQLLWKGKPLANQLVYTGINANESGIDHVHEHSDESAHDHYTDVTSDHEHQHDNTSGLRTDENGVVNINLQKEGIYYVRTIHLANSEKEGLTHESNWATLTFEIGHGHSHDPDQDHSHSHEDENGVPMFVYLIGSILIIGGLFFWYNRKA